MLSKKTTLCFTFFSYFASLSFWLHLSIYAFEAISFKRFFSVKFVEMDFLRAIFLLDKITAFVSGTELSVFLVCLSWKEKNDVFARHFRHRQREYANVNYDELYRQNRTTCVSFFSAYNMRQSCKITTMNRKKNTSSTVLNRHKSVKKEALNLRFFFVSREFVGKKSG